MRTVDRFDKLRFGLITGSNCTPLFPKRSAEVGQQNLAKKLAKERYFKFYDEVNTWQMQHGHDAEEFALEYCREHFDPSVKEGGFIKKGECGGTLDAEGDGVWDWKSPTSLEGWLSYLHDGMSPDQENQMQMYMYLTGHKRARIGAFLMETYQMSDNGITYPVARDKRMIVVETKFDPYWVKKLSENAPKVIEMRDKYIKQLKEQFG